MEVTTANPRPHQMITCPYESAHVVEHYRMHIHLQKCRKQHPKCNKATCPFDATHIVNDVELDFHVSVCSKRDMLDTQLYITDDDHRPVVEMPPPAPAPALPSEENWDDVAVTSYIPDPSKKGSHIITKPRGMTRSERQKHRSQAIRTYKPLD